MRYLRYISLLFILASCGTPKPFSQAQPATTAASTSIFQPTFSRELYRCEVNGKFLFKQFHLSGLLLLRHFDDSTTRVVFQNEMGITYFDFGWNAEDSFQVFHIIDKMNKPALIRTLQKDFEIILGKNIGQTTQTLTTKNNDVLSRHAFYQGYLYYYRSENHPQEIYQIDYGTDKRTLVRFGLMPPIRLTKPELPDSVAIKHYKAGFTIQLHQLKQNYDD